MTETVDGLYIIVDPRAAGKSVLAADLARTMGFGRRGTIMCNEGETEYDGFTSALHRPGFSPELLEQFLAGQKQAQASPAFLVLDQLEWDPRFGRDATLKLICSHCRELAIVVIMCASHVGGIPADVRAHAEAVLMLRNDGQCEQLHRTFGNPWTSDEFQKHYRECTKGYVPSSSTTIPCSSTRRCNDTSFESTGVNGRLASMAARAKTGCGARR